MCYQATKFGAYFQAGAVNQISARWIVPTILSPPISFRHISTWVGVQHTTTGGPFIQVGTHIEAVGSAIRYYAFWSDTANDDVAQRLFPVTPGDAVFAGAAHTAHGWRLTFRDLTSGRSRSFTVRYARNVGFSVKDWAVEDTSGCAVSPYPQTSTVTMKDLKLNGKRPRLRYDSANVLESPNGVTLVPTRVHRDEFSLVPPSGARAQYLAATAPFNIAFERFLGAVGQARMDAAVTHETAMVQKGARLTALTEVSPVLAAAHRARRELAAVAATPAQRGDLRRVESSLSALTASLQRASGRFRRSTRWALEPIESNAVQLQRRAARLRRALGLPANQPSGASLLPDAPL